MPSIIIIGAGLAGSLLAIYLARRGFGVEIYEARGDIRTEEVAAGRSINLALSDRGIAALREVGMDEYMLSEAVPMYGRMIHSDTGETKLLPYSGRKGEYINSVSRAGLNIALINEAVKYDGVRFHFNEPCADFDCDSGEVKLGSGNRVSGDTVIAADGAGSAVRQAIEHQLPSFEAHSAFLEHGYKELHIPPATGDSKFAIEPNALHVWPRHQFMMIALPNFDGSFTCTLFLAHKGSDWSGERPARLATGTVAAPVQDTAFDRLLDEKTLLEFFNLQFRDAVPLMPTLVEDFFANPTGQLGTLKCWPWHVGGKVLLLGDSAHAMVPFFGQGMNCAFEDVRVLDQLIGEAEPSSSAGGFPQKIDWAGIFEKYSAVRRPNTDAIQDMAEENFYEMRDATANAIFQRKRELETKLEHTYPDYFSKYSMVTFRDDLPYSVAKEKGNAQDNLLMLICARVEDTSKLDLELVIKQIRAIK